MAYTSSVVTVHAKIQQGIRLHEDLLTIVKRHKLVVWTCLPFIRSGQNHLAGYSERGEKTRQTKNNNNNKKSWEDNIKEWTGLELVKSQKAVENIEKWRKLVVKSFVVSQRPPRLRDRCS